MVRAVGMIAKNENSNVKKGRWPSLLKCIQSLAYSLTLCIPFFISLSFCFSISALSPWLLCSFMPTRADARKQQQQEESGSAPVQSEVQNASVLADQDQRKTLKFGFSSKGGTSKVCMLENT